MLLYDTLRSISRFPKKMYQKIWGVKTRAFWPGGALSPRTPMSGCMCRMALNQSALASFDHPGPFSCKQYYCAVSPDRSGVNTSRLTKNDKKRWKSGFRRYWEKCHENWYSPKRTKAPKQDFESVEGAKIISARQIFPKFYFCCRQKFLAATNVAFWSETNTKFVATRNF